MTASPIDNEAPARNGWAGFAWPLVGAAAAAIMLSVLLMQPVWRFGDGSEYYALYLAILEHGRPFMTEGAWRDYSSIAIDGSIPQMVDTATLRATFPSLADAHTADFNHFWFYPALAAIVAAPFKLVGLKLGPHTAFLALHAILFGITLALAGRLRGVRGVVAAALLFVASPILWFATKVHTEFFTIALVLQTFILISRGKFFYAALPIALASTQNISLAATAWALIAFGLLANHMSGRSAALREMVVAGLALLATALHPLYYLYRHDVITPQLKAGGAVVGGNADQLLAVLIDPDIGLFTNWWFGTFILVAGLVLAARSRPKLKLAYTAIAAIYVVTNLFAQASTTNLNSGSIDLSRYALWYVPVFYAPLVWLLGEASRKPTRWLVSLTLVGVASLLVVWNLGWYWPTRHERYTEPTIFSRVLQSKFPGLYDPPPEIFYERNSGHGETDVPVAAIAGPDCRKLYVPPQLLGATSIKVVSRHRCAFDEDLLAALVADRLADNPPQDKSHGMYVRLDDSDLRHLQLRFAVGRIGFGADANGANALAAGWNIPEPWGTWSNSTHPRIEIDLANCGSDVLQAKLNARGFAIPENPRVVVAVKVQGRQVGSYDFTADSPGPKRLKFDYSCADAVRAGNMLALDFEITGAASPSALGLSSDNRLLGIGVEWIEISRRPAAEH